MGESRSGVPQLPQNRPRSSGAPHEGQAVDSALPHSRQNAVPSGDSAPQDGQERTGTSPADVSDATLWTARRA